MLGRLESFELRGDNLARIVDTTTSRFSSATTGVLLLAGSPASRAREIAAALSRRVPQATLLIVPATGVLSEAGEVESEAGAVGLCLPGVRSQLLLEEATSTAFGQHVAERLGQGPGSTAMVFLRGDQTDEGWLEALWQHADATQARIFGGGTLPRLDLWLVQNGSVQRGAAGALIIERPLVGRVFTSAACRLISPLHAVTRARGNLLLELDGVPALDLLGASTEDQNERELILLALAATETPLGPEGRNVALRAIVGVDPDQHAIVVGEALASGTQVAFAVRDPHGARQDLDSHLAALRRSCQGAAPTFGLYVSCAGRGKTLYGTPDVDVRLIKRHFPGMPLAGFHSTFEVAPLGGRLTPQVYGGVLGVFCSPS